MRNGGRPTEMKWKGQNRLNPGGRGRGPILKEPFEEKTQISLGFTLILLCFCCSLIREKRNFVYRHIRVHHLLLLSSLWVDLIFIFPTSWLKTISDPVLHLVAAYQYIWEHTQSDCLGHCKLARPTKELVSSGILSVWTVLCLIKIRRCLNNLTDSSPSL